MSTGKEVQSSRELKGQMRKGGLSLYLGGKKDNAKQLVSKLCEVLCI